MVDPIIDLIDLKWLEFDPATDGKVINYLEIPEQYRDDATLWREQLLEVVYELNEEAAALALEDLPVPREMIIETLRKATLARQIQPVFCGSALHGLGVQPLLTGVNNFLPSPLDRPPVEGVDPANATASCTVNRATRSRSAPSSSRSCPPRRVTIIGSASTAAPFPKTHASLAPTAIPKKTSRSSGRSTPANAIAMARST